MTALVAILAGGRGRRMGAFKPAVELAGRPLIAWPLAAAREAGLDAVVVAKPDASRGDDAGAALPELGAPVWREPAEPVHPLVGVVTALERARRPVVAVACDMPFVTAALLARLATGPEAAVRVGGAIQPFPARFEPPALPALKRAVAAGAAVRETVAALAPQSLELDDPRIVASVNTPAELAAAASGLVAAAETRGRGSDRSTNRPARRLAT